MNYGHWMDGALGVPTWLWLVATVVLCLIVIFWIWGMARAGTDGQKHLDRIRQIDPEHLMILDMARVMECRPWKMRFVFWSAVRRGQFRMVKDGHWKERVYEYAG